MINFFQNKHILITGVGIGIGRSLAKLLDGYGCRLTLVDKDRTALDSLVGELSSDFHTAVGYDFSELEGIDDLVHQCISNGPLNGLVHCVGIRSRRPLGMITSQLLMDVMRINYFSFVMLVKAAVKKDRFAEGFSIVAVSSIAAQRGASAVLPYASSKAALESGVRVLAKELSVKGIRVNCVVPSQINTPAYQEMMNSTGMEEDHTLKRQFLGLGKPEDVASTIAFLLSPASGFISGASIPVDGGYLNS
jgi:NAD(P)-dependent dehydrogenase (short-subunit alcohol dehydrogenase family)